jgi:hypothetical protein
MKRIKRKIPPIRHARFALASLIEERIAAGDSQGYTLAECKRLRELPDDDPELWGREETKRMMEYLAEEEKRAGPPSERQLQELSESPIAKGLPPESIRRIALAKRARDRYLQ